MIMMCVQFYMLLQSNSSSKMQVGSGGNLPSVNVKNNCHLCSKSLISNKSNYFYVWWFVLLDFSWRKPCIL